MKDRITRFEILAFEISRLKGAIKKREHSLWNPVERRIFFKEILEEIKEIELKVDFEISEEKSSPRGPR